MPECVLVLLRLLFVLVALLALLAIVLLVVFGRGALRMVDSGVAEVSPTAISRS